MSSQHVREAWSKVADELEGLLPADRTPHIDRDQEV